MLMLNSSLTATFPMRLASAINSGFNVAGFWTHKKLGYVYQMTPANAIVPATRGRMYVERGISKMLRAK